MKKYFTLSLLATILLLLTGCVDKVEEKTIVCTEGDEEVFKLVFQEDRVMEYDSSFVSLERDEDFEELLTVEALILEEFNGENFFDIEDAMLTDIESNLEISCQLTTKKVTYEEDPEFDGVNVISENILKDDILAEALMVNNASKLYCALNECSETQELTWDDINEYIEGIDEDDYDLTNNAGVVSRKIDGKWTVDMERSGTGEWEFTEGLDPTECDRTCVIEDID